MTSPRAERPGVERDPRRDARGLEITPFRKNVLRQRWLDQVAWMGRKARESAVGAPALSDSRGPRGRAIPGLVAILLSAGGSEHGRSWPGGFPASGSGSSPSSSAWGSRRWRRSKR